MKILLLGIAAMVLGACSNAGSGASNADATDAIIPVANAGFEDAASKDSVSKWTLEQHAGQLAYESVIDTGVHSGGHASFRMTRIRKQVYGSITQVVPIPHAVGKEIELSAMLKTKDVGALGWQLFLMLPGDQVQSSPVIGTTDWRRVKIRARIPEGATTVTIGATLLDSGAGWIDDVSLRTLKP